MVKIIGAGMAGLLAGCMFRGEAQIFEASASLPNNHHSLLRFKTDMIGRHLNIPFRQVDVIKTSKRWVNPVADALAYSFKCTGQRLLRSSVTAKGEIEKRFIAPEDLIKRMEDHLNSPVLYGQMAGREFFQTAAVDSTPVISTMPMPALMQRLGYANPNSCPFKSVDGAVITVKLETAIDACATVYYPDPAFPPSRASITGDILRIEIPFTRIFEFTIDQLIEEMLSNKEYTWLIIRRVLFDFGLEFLAEAKHEVKYEVAKQKYAKILPIDERERKKFIMWATDVWGVYSLGRFAVWKPGLLLDDVFNDILAIQEMMQQTNYKRKMK